MTKQIVFIIALLATLGIFTYTVLRLISFFRLTKPYPVRDFGKRLRVMLKVAFGQTKIFRFPVIGFLHALVFWGFCVILIGSIEMVIDGIAGTERALGSLGLVYDIIMASGDVFALIIFVAILIFLFRRIFLHVKRFGGIEMKHSTHIDANIALTLILLLMVTLLGMNTAYVAGNLQGEIAGVYPVSNILAGLLKNFNSPAVHLIHEVNWWGHILLIFFFANYLPYSKHFHVFMSVPNVFLSRLEPLGKLPNMDSITAEVKSMLNPDTAFAEPSGDTQPIGRFGVKDVEDITWKNYFDSLACTQCGRCTSVCPANITGKMLSPRKIIMDVRARMNEKGPGLVKNGKDYSDNKSLLKDYITAEELWACTTCNACAQECPININHPTLIVEMRRYLVMEEAAAPGELNAIFTNIENNGAPWQFSPEDRLNWVE
ncbi:MAG: (Fe-S)-binding protein [Bacteroidales bacterium]|nr:(Fe-S)-binding protein [Bacteroidales bacterium]